MDGGDGPFIWCVGWGRWCQDPESPWSDSNTQLGYILRTCHSTLPRRTSQPAVWIDTHRLKWFNQGSRNILNWQKWILYIFMPSRDRTTSTWSQFPDLSFLQLRRQLRTEGHCQLCIRWSFRNAAKRYLHHPVELFASIDVPPVLMSSSFNTSRRDLEICDRRSLRQAAKPRAVSTYVAIQNYDNERSWSVRVIPPSRWRQKAQSHSCLAHWHAWYLSNQTVKSPTPQKSHSKKKTILSETCSERTFLSIPSHGLIQKAAFAWWESVVCSIICSTSIRT